MMNTCFGQLIVPEDLAYHQTIFVEFPDIGWYVHLNQLTRGGWNAFTIHHDETFDTPDALLNWLVSINYGIDFTGEHELKTIRYVRTDAEKKELTTTGTVQRCLSDGGE